EGDWERFFEIAGPLLRSLAIFPAIGNHEYSARGKGLVAFMQYFRWPLALPDDEPPWYSFDVGAAHFVALDSNSYKSARQLSWLDRDLREARRRGARALFVYAHEGPASSGMHGDNSVCVRDYVPVMERHRVSMFFGGHDHDYERGRLGALDYVVTGGGGAELRAARCGVPGKRACPPRVAAFVNDHNYVMVEVLPSLFRICPKRVDGTPIEACTQYPLH
ncbi:MAG: metallophosphoesterase family protein, partial [Polyangia bacterium]